MLFKRIKRYAIVYSDRVIITDTILDATDRVVRELVFCINTLKGESNTNCIELTSNFGYICREKHYKYNKSKYFSKAYIPVEFKISDQLIINGIVDYKRFISKLRGLGYEINEECKRGDINKYYDEHSNIKITHRFMNLNKFRSRI